MAFEVVETSQVFMRTVAKMNQKGYLSRR
ncbi:hypothetical protein [Psychrobacter sp. WY6]